MNLDKTLKLTSCQLKAKDEIEAWLMTENSPEFILSGGAGVGKSTLVELILGNISEINDMCELAGINQKLYEVLFTATTNKAASVINGGTIYSLLGISIYNDYKTGEVVMNTKNAKAPYNCLIIVDESSMVDDKLLKEIQTYCKDCKVLYVGDKNQLHPVGLTYSPVFDGGISQVHMDTPCRQDYDSHLYRVITDVKKWVETGVPCQLIAGEGVTFINDMGLADFIDNPSSSDKIITFTNDSCIQLNQFVRHRRGLSTDFFTEGEQVMSNTTTVPPKGSSKGRILTDAQYTISNINPIQSYNGWFDYRSVRLNSISVPVPTCPQQFKNVLNKLKANKDWRTYYKLKESIVDIRDAYAVTTHKSQGSTYDRVFINLNNFKRCPDKNMLARLLYVAISRARKEVFLYGSL